MKVPTQLSTLGPWIALGKKRLHKLVQHRLMPKRLSCYQLKKQTIRNLRPTMARIVSCTEGLTEEWQHLEERFLDVGTVLESQATSASLLVRQSEDLLQYIVGLKGGDAEMVKAVALLQPTLAFIADSETQAVELTGRLRTYHQQIINMKRHESSLEAAVAPLKFIQTLFRVESAALPPEQQNIFTGLTKDIEQLHSKVSEVFGEQFQALARSEITLSTLIQRLETQSTRQHKLITEKQALIQKSLADLQSDFAGHQNQDVRLTRISKEIAEEASRIVFGLQFQDITSQQLAHITEGLAEMQASFDEYASQGGRCSTEETHQRLQFFIENSRLQRNQLEEVVKALAKASDEIARGLTNLNSHTLTLDEDCVSLNNFKTISAAPDGMVQVLLNIIQDVRELVATTVALQDEVYTTIEPLGGLASNLTGVMRQLSTSIKLIALNAQVQAAHIGSGTGLEVLAESTCSISDATYQLNEDAACELEVLVKGIESTIRECAELRDRGREQTRRLAEDGVAVESSLHAYRDATLKALLDVGETAAKLQLQSADAREAANFVDIIGPRITELQTALEEVVRQSQNQDDSLTAFQAGLSTAHLRDNYTMASERIAHEKSLNAGAGTAAAAPAVAPASDTPVLFEETPTIVELAPPPPSSTAPAPAPAPEAPSDVPAENAPAAPPSSAPPAPSDSSLGDNTELF